jgi:hypothetical protein
MQRRPASDLERAIILALSNSPAPTIAELAQRVYTTRPSVSRAAHRLIARKLLRHADGTWNLTALGKQAAAALVSDVPARSERQVGRAISAMERSVRHQRRWQRLASGGNLGAIARRHEQLEATLMRSFVSNVTELSSGLVNTTLASDALRALLPASVMNDDFRTLLPLQHTALLEVSGVRAEMRNFFTTALSGVITPALRTELIAFAPMASALEILGGSQQRIMEALMPTMPDVSALLGPSISSVTGLIADLYEMPRLTAGFDRALSAALLAPVTHVGEALRLHLTSELEQTASTRRGTWSSEFAHIALIGPTDATARLVRTVRSSIESEPMPPDLTQEGERSGALARQLRDISPRLAELRDGAWAAVVSVDPASAWSSAHLARELVSQVLHELAPDAVFTAGERAAHDGRVTRVMRVQRIVAADSPTAAAWIETTAATVDSTYELLSADAHSHRERPRFDRDQRIGMLETVDGLLRVIVGFAKRSSVRN